MRPRGTAFLIAAALLLAGAGAAPEPSGYRMSGYHAPTPVSLRGGRVIATDEAHALWQRHAAVFVDVMAAPQRPSGLPPGTIWRDKPRDDIPGSIWLPDTGYGALAPVMQAYFVRGLHDATKGDRNRTLVLYCKADCWMSWNAARRAIALGYTHVDWFRDGTTGWAAAHLPLQRATPIPRPPEQAPAS